MEHHQYILGIDATNIRQGGGQTHLVELIRAFNPESHGISKIVIWATQSTLARFEDFPWLEKVNHPLHEQGLFGRTVWQRFFLSRAARQSECKLLFVPGGSFSGNFAPVVAMSQNMLPFELRELHRFGWSVATLKLRLLRFIQARTFKKADGVLFLTQYAKSAIEQKLGSLEKFSIVSHGIDKRFVMQPRKQHTIESYTAQHPFNILYVSTIDQYKHQWNVIEAIAKLRLKTDWNLSLDLVGPSYPPALRRLQASIDTHDSKKKWVRYHGKIPFEKLHTIYQKAQMGLFASTCENMPNILLETMAAGVPVACSNFGPMPEVLKDTGVYFNPEDPSDISDSVQKLIASPELRTKFSISSFKESNQYTWARCADETFGFFNHIQAAHRKTDLIR